MTILMTHPARLNPAIATGIAGLLLGTVIGTTASWASPRVPSAATPTEHAASNLGQYSVLNMGGTRPAAGPGPNLGQYSVRNLGGTRVE